MKTNQGQVLTEFVISMVVLLTVITICFNMLKSGQQRFREQRFKYSNPYSSGKRP